MTITLKKASAIDLIAALAVRGYEGEVITTISSNTWDSEAESWTMTIGKPRIYPVDAASHNS